MSQASSKTKVDNVSAELSDGKGSQDSPNQKFANSELVIGLVGAVGTELNKAVEIIKDRLKSYNYKVHEIRISKDIISDIIDVGLPPTCTDEFKRINTLMDAGDEARQKSGDNSILALGTAAWIQYLGKKPEGDITIRDPRPRNAYIINSLKHPEEVLQLRRIYPLGFYLLGVYAKETRRHNYLVKDRQISEANAKLLMDRDKDEKLPYGQCVTETFHMSDFFVHLGDSQDQLKKSLWRFFDILFGHPYKTPTFDEYAMFQAHVAALRSASLSRQVGAVIGKHNEILATGANDCPKYEGGLYWPYFDKEDGEIKDVPKGRDHKRGEDSNEAQLKQIKMDIINAAKASGIDIEKLKEVLDLSPIKDLTEFGRAVHAEMEALLSCARNHGNTRDATLYTTTFPCHNCARHIIAAGIVRVVYIEPYEKSKAIKLHDEAISLSFFSDQEGASKVCFEPFVGVGPRRFFDLFSMRLGSGNKLIRKDSEGKVLKWKPKNGNLRLQMLPSSYLDLELDSCDKFSNVYNKMKGCKK